MTDPQTSGLEASLGGARATPALPVPPPGHALVAVDQLLQDRELYVSTLAPQLPMEALVRAMVLHVLYALGPDEVAIEHLSYNLLFRWFIGDAWRPEAYVASRSQLVELEGDRSPFARAISRVELRSFRPDMALLAAWSCEALLTFEDLGRMGDRSLQRLIREVDITSLGVALWDVPEPFFQRFKQNMTARMGAMLEETMGYVPRAPEPHSIEQFRAALLVVAKRLARRGEIELPPR